MELFTKPAAALYRGRAYFILALILWILHNTVTPPFEFVTDKSTWQLLIDKGIGSLDKPAYLVFLAGLVYVVLADLSDYLWTSKIHAELKSGFKNIGDTIATGVSGISHESVMAWVTRGLGNNTEYREIGVSSLHEFYGKENPERSSYLEYVCENILDKSMPSSSISRKQYVEQIVIRKTNGDDLFQWEDDRRYVLFCPAGKGTHPVSALISGRGDVSNINSILGKLSLSVSVDGKQIFSFADWFKSTGGMIGSSPPYKRESDGGKLEWDGRWYTFEYMRAAREAQTRVS